MLDNDQPDWRAVPHAELDATLDKWLMLGPDHKPLGAVPDRVLDDFATLAPELRTYIRYHHAEQLAARYPDGEPSPPPEQGTFGLV